MKTSRLNSYLSATVLLGALLAFASPAQAKTRSGTYTTSRGKSGSLTQTTTRSAGQVDRSSSLTNQNGQTAAKNSTRTFNQSAGTSAYNSTATGFNGKTATVNSSSSTNSDGSISTNGSRTGFNGKTESFAATKVPGSSTTGTITGANGKTASFTSTPVKDSDGLGHDATITGPNGQTASRDVYNQKNPDGSITRSVETTKPDGTTNTKTATLTPVQPPTP
jgi:hypothetical protein